jgi:hypothetical protein
VAKSPIWAHWQRLWALSPLYLHGLRAQNRPCLRDRVILFAGRYTYPWSMPCCAIGHTAEKLAGDLDEGMPVLISAAELCYRKRDTKAGEVSRMEILVWHAQVGQADLAGVAQEQRTASPEYRAGGRTDKRS